MTLDEFHQHVADDGAMFRKLLDLRGGCTCFLSPPCGNCVEPITEHEAECLGWERPEPDVPLHKIMEGWR